MSVNKVCELCDNPADYATVEGGWLLCKACVINGNADGVGE
jgi:hypothetical protein